MPIGDGFGGCGPADETQTVLTREMAKQAVDPLADRAGIEQSREQVQMIGHQCGPERVGDGAPQLVPQPRSDVVVAQRSGGMGDLGDPMKHGLAIDPHIPF